MSAPDRRDASIAQDQFLEVLSRDEAARRFEEALRPAPLGPETVPLAAALGRVVARDIAAPGDVPPFDRSVVDGFAVRARDLEAASEAAPIRLRLNREIIACGTAPRLAVGQGTATPIATGGPLPRGADAVVMIEHTQPASADAIEVRRASLAGQFVGHAGSDIARGESLLRRGTVIGSREIGMLAACGMAAIEVFQKPRVAVLSTGDELVQPGTPLRPAAIHDANGPVVAAAVAENGGEPDFRGAVPDEADALRTALRAAFDASDMVILSGGTSKGAGDLTAALVETLGRPGIVAHGVALKPGKPLCLAVCDGKAVVVLPGFPTSAMFTFHDIVAPVLRRLAGLPEREVASVPASLAARVASELGRTEFVMVSLIERDGAFLAYPAGKGSGAVTAFAQADGFFAIEALADSMPAGAEVDVTLFSPHLAIPDLVVIGSHDLGLDALGGRLAARGVSMRIMALGSQGGLAALRRGECDIAPIHLLDPASGTYNRPFLDESMALVEGWRRRQGIVFRPGDPRFDGRDVRTAVAAAIADPACIMVNRNAGAGTRIIIDGLLGSARPDGYANQPRSHHAVGAAVAQGRADWGVAIEQVARDLGLGFIAVADEHYDFALARERMGEPAVAAFLDALTSEEGRSLIAALGYGLPPP